MSSRSRTAAPPHCRLRLTESAGTAIHAIALRCQVRILPQRRGYAAEEEPGLLDLFGERGRWPTTLKSFLWMQCSTLVQGFSGSTEVEDLPLPCTFDFDVAAAKYLNALRDGEIPLQFLFSGTVFTKGQTGFGVEQVPWDLEASYRLPRVRLAAADGHVLPQRGLDPPGPRRPGGPVAVQVGARTDVVGGRRRIPAGGCSVHGVGGKRLP